LADGDHEVLAEKRQDLAQLNDLVGVHVASRLQHHEEGVAVDLELRALVGVDRVLHGQLV